MHLYFMGIVDCKCKEIQKANSELEGYDAVRNCGGKERASKFAVCRSFPESMRVAIAIS